MDTANSRLEQQHQQRPLRNVASGRRFLWGEVTPEAGNPECESRHQKERTDGDVNAHTVPMASLEMRFDGLNEISSCRDAITGP